MIKCAFQNWGLIGYEEARLKQLSLFTENLDLKLKGKEVQNLLVMCEHKPVITLGKSANIQHLLFTEKWLNERGVDLCQTERGGDITYHGPGQLVVYPLFDIEQMGLGVKAYIHTLESCIIQTLAHIGITAERYEGFTGVWLSKDTHEARKMAAIGVKCSRGVTMHGLALNVHTDLTYFDLIVPCGIAGKAVTSIKKELNSDYTVTQAVAIMKNEFANQFGLVFEDE
jgi:lipoyl(octanoyl) transferase